MDCITSKSDINELNEKLKNKCYINNIDYGLFIKWVNQQIKRSWNYFTAKDTKSYINAYKKIFIDNIIEDFEPLDYFKIMNVFYMVNDNMFFNRIIDYYKNETYTEYNLHKDTVEYKWRSTISAINKMVKQRNG